MSKFYTSQNDWYRVATLSLAVAVIGGMLLRLQYAGLFSVPLDLRRAHSHLGFFGFLFPILWHELQKEGWWAPGPILKEIYIVLLVCSTFGFAVSGYGVISHISSTFVLIIWLVFAFKNLKSCQGHLRSIPISIILSAIIVLIVAGANKLGLTISILQLVRIFLFILLFGVFGSLVISRVGKRDLFPVIWVVSTVGTGIFLADIKLSYLFTWAPMTLGLSILYSIFEMNFSFYKVTDRIRGYLFILACILILLSFGIILNNHFTAIAGIHFFIFLIIAPYFLVFGTEKFCILFEMTSVAMSMLLIIPNFISLNYSTYQIALSIVSLIAVFLICFGLRSSKLTFTSTHENRKRRVEAAICSNNEHI